MEEGFALDHSRGETDQRGRTGMEQESRGVVRMSLQSGGQEQIGSGTAIH